ncbi:MAG: hypothetical protein RBS80_31550 [Thermoguttaceae bacterium]|jgi:hypothetical protein|nr:hypothetical protein [Thermoguttaceae bacterium]
MVHESAVKRVLEAVWDKASQNGWPVNAGDIDMFGDDPVVAKRSLRNVVAECEKRGYLEATLDGDIHGISESAKAYIGVA